MMKARWIIVWGLALAPLAHAEHTRVTYPSAVSVEVLGKGLAFAVQYDRVLNDDLVAGFGYGSVSLNRGQEDTGQSVSLIPVYAHYYFTRDQASFFGAAGFTIVTDATKSNGLEASTGALKFSSSPVIPVIGLGYENRTDTGFLFRATAYGMLAKSYAPWVGVTFGYAF
ncbi:MAG: hypothetical protein NDJ89_14050 [Oligoflexia bacterium]|nr:hypothetical protein [Oligoflexia bacterium]